MATREAAIKITLRQGAFKSGLRSMMNDVRSAGASMGAALAGPMKAGLKSAQAQMKMLAAGATGFLKQAATFGGAFAVGAMIKKSIDLQGKFRDIAFQVEKATGKMGDWREVQALAQDAASKTGRTSEEMADAFQALYAATGDVEFSSKALEHVGVAATATGKDVAVLANVAQTLQRKFGIASDELPEALTRFIEKTDVGGKSMDELGNKFAIMAGEAAQAGFKGKDGISELLGVMIDLDSRVGEGSERGFKKIFQALKDGSAEMKRFKKEGKIKFGADVQGFDKLRGLMTGKGRVVAEQLFTAESRTVFDELARPFDEAMQKAKQNGATAEEATKAGLEAFDAAMKNAGKSTLTYEKLQKQTNARLEDDPSTKMRQAMEKLQQAFSAPEMQNAIDSLAKNLPKLAETIAKVVDFSVKNPALAVGGAVAGRVGLSFAGGALTDAGGKLAGAAISNLRTGLPAVGQALGSSIATSASAAGPWKTAGTVLGAAAALAIGFEMGKYLSKETVEKDLDAASGAQKSLIETDVSAFSKINSGDRAAKEKALADLEAQIAAAKKKSDVTRKEVSTGDIVAGAAGFLATGGLGALLGIGLKRGGEKDLVGGRGEITAAEQTAEMLRSSLDKGADGHKDAAKELKAAAVAIKDAARTSAGGAAGGTTKGPKPLGGVTPGAAPRGG